MTPPEFKVDIAATPPVHGHPLHQVGMSRIDCPVQIALPGIAPLTTPASIDAYVDLHGGQKGIHMSRLFLMVESELGNHPLSPKLLVQLIEKFIKSHDGLSEMGHVSVSFDLLLKRTALKSKYPGWRRYPVRLWADGSLTEREMGMDVMVAYSSTCPCSAALARELIQKKFSADFPHSKTFTKEDILGWLGLEASIAGTPHGQRSEARIQTTLKTALQDLSFIVETIDTLEQALATPVQAAVKREDEQEFARLNAENLMFAEDAARKMQAAMSTLKHYKNFAIEARHLESLHAHDAVAKVQSLL